MRVPLYWWDIARRVWEHSPVKGVAGVGASLIGSAFLAYVSAVVSHQSAKDLRWVLLCTVAWFGFLAFMSLLVGFLRAAPGRDLEKEVEIARLRRELESLHSRFEGHVLHVEIVASETLPVVDRDTVRGRIRILDTEFGPIARGSAERFRPGVPNVIINEKGGHHLVVRVRNTGRENLESVKLSIELWPRVPYSPDPSDLPSVDTFPTFACIEPGGEEIFYLANFTEFYYEVFVLKEAPAKVHDHDVVTKVIVSGLERPTLYPYGNVLGWALAESQPPTSPPKRGFPSV